MTGYPQGPLRTQAPSDGLTGAIGPTNDHHDIDTRLHREGAYDRGWFALCTCDWTGPLRDLNRRGQALLDGYQHQREMKEAAA